MVSSNEHAWIFGDDSIYTNIPAYDPLIKKDLYSKRVTPFKLNGTGSHARYEYNDTLTKKKPVKIFINI